jgi:hypothetical protein
VLEYGGQPMPPDFAARIAALPALVGAVDVSPNNTCTMYTFAGVGALQRLNARTFIGHIGGAFGVGGTMVGAVPIHLIELSCNLLPAFWY